MSSYHLYWLCCVSCFFALTVRLNLAFTEPSLLSQFAIHLNKKEIIFLANECFVSSNCNNLEFEKCFISSWQVADNNLQTSVTNSNFSDTVLIDKFAVIDNENQFDASVLTPTLTPIVSPTKRPTRRPTASPTKALDIVQVDLVTDSSRFGNSESCRLDHVTGSCNLRSAVEYCVSESSSRYCEIHLPVEGAVVLNSSLPHMYVTGRIQPGAQFLTIVGHGSTLSLAGDHYARLMEVGVTDANPFSLELLDLTVQGFFGAFFLSGLQSFKCSRINFLNNSAPENDGGGAVTISHVITVDFVDSVFSNNVGSFLDGGALSVSYVSNLTMTDCEVINNKGYMAGGVYIYGRGNTFISNTLFSSNGASDASVLGGALMISSQDRLTMASLTMTDCDFIHNEADTGGGVYLKGFIDAVITNTLFRDNHADSIGGALCHYDAGRLTMTGCDIINNEADTGGGFYLRGLIDVVITNTSFRDNHADSIGGALYHYDAGRFTMTGCDIINNEANSGGGGGLRVFASDATTITNTLFSSNHAFSGGALYYDAHRLTMTGCDFISNEADRGGGVYITTSDAATISNILFSNNHADYNGGAFYLYGSDYLKLSNSYFISNVAAARGGGMYLDLSNGNDLIKNTSFVSNMSPEGGGIYSNSNPALGVVDCLFNSNKASLSGGGVFLNFENKNFNIRNCRFENNFALESGAAMYIFSKNQFLDDIRNCFFSNNLCLLAGGGAIASMFENKFRVTNCKFTNNSAYEGGAIFSYFKNELWFSQLQVSLNNATNGGAISIGREDTVSLSDCNLTFNTAQNNGGGIVVSPMSNLDINQSSLIKNRAQNLGGAVYFESNNFNFANSVVNDNSASREGGGIYVMGRNIRIVKSSFTSNSVLGSTGSGSAMFFDVSSEIIIYQNKFSDNIALDKGALTLRSCYAVAIENNTFSSNSALIGAGTAVIENSKSVNFTENIYMLNDAAEDGGGLYIEKSSNIQLSRLIIYSNTASSGGGLHVEAVENINIDKCSFEKNVASRYGGAAVIDQSKKLSVVDNKVISNLASSDGGGIYVEKSSDILLSRLVFMYNEATTGGGLHVEAAEDITIDMCSFEENIAHQNGGAAIIVQSKKLSMINNEVISNLASSDGGGLCLFAVDIVSVLGNNFERNIATSGSGSAVWLTSSPTVILRRNYFLNNEALNGGGAVHWVYSQTMISEPKGLSTKSNVFWNNRALYGEDYSSTGSSLSCGRGGENILTYDYSNELDPINVTVRDFYGQLYPLANLQFAQAQINGTSCISNPYPRIVGGTSSIFTGGLATFDAIKPTCNQAGFFTLQFSTSMPYSEDLRTFCDMQINFRPCQPGEIFTSSYTCAKCPPGSYSLVIPTPETQCLKCPKDATDCFGKQIIVPYSFWRESENSSEIYSCVEGSTFCKGGDKAGDESCETGHKGLLCEECWDGYYYDNTYQKCLLCDSNSLNVGGIVLVSALGALVLVFLIYNILQFFRLNLLNGADFSFTTLVFLFYVKVFASKDGKTNEIEFKENYMSLLDRFSSKFKIYFSLFQILSNMKLNIDIEYSGLYRSLIDAVKPVVSPFRLQSISNLGFSCSYEMDFVDSLLIVTLSPIFISIALAVFYHCHCYYLKNYKLPTTTEEANKQEVKTSENQEEQKNANKLHAIAVDELFSNYFFLFLVGSYVILPGLSASIFQAFPCQEFQHGSFLRADLAISCDSARYKEGLAVGIVMVIVYVVGVPFMYFCLLYHNRKHISRRDKENKTPEISIRPYHFLYSSYEPHYWYWEVVETYRRIILSGVVVVLVNFGSSIQIVLSIFVTLLFIKLYAYCQPFEDDYIDVDGEFAQYQLFLILFMTLLIKQDVFDSFWLDVALCVVALSMFLLSPYRWLSERSQEKLYNQKYIDQAKGVTHSDLDFSGRDVFSDGDVTMSLRSVERVGIDKSLIKFYEQLTKSVSTVNVGDENIKRNASSEEKVTQMSKLSTNRIGDDDNSSNRV